MRMRFKPYAHDELMAADFHVHEPLIWGGRWHAQYARPEQPFVLELGCGKGGFISQLASAHPENNYLGIDITDKVLILAKRKIEAAYQEAGRPIDNVKIMSTDIERIKGVLTPEDTVSRIYINFCNPWSKNASSNKHRLTYPRQLIQYRAFLEDGGEIYFKTDDDDLFRDSLEYFPASGYEITWKTFDLHENEPAWNIRTEHEGMFTEMGIKIKALIARKLPGDAAVVTVMSSFGFFRFAREQGIHAETTKVGDRYVLENMRKNGYNIGGEQSGHIIFREYMPTGDGELSAIQLMRVMKKTGEPLSVLAGRMPITPQVLLNVAADRDMKEALHESPEMEVLIEECEHRLGDTGRILIRASGTEPLIRVMVEAKTTEIAHQVASVLADFIKKL